MNYRKNLMTGLIGLALLATPVIAAAKDSDSDKHDSHQSQSQSNSHPAASHSDRAPAHFNAPARNEAPAMAPRHEQATENRHEFRDQPTNRTFNSAPAVETHRDFRQDQREATAARRDFHEDRREARSDDRDRDHDGWRHDHPDYDYDNDRHWGPYYTGGPYYVMPEGYAGGACSWARHLRAVYNHDRYTGHPEAAEALLPRVHRAERSCGIPYGYNRYRY
jgi:hypothetical protein